jgi:hypothetical protein
MNVFSVSLKTTRCCSLIWLAHASTSWPNLFHLCKNISMFTDTKWLWELITRSILWKSYQTQRIDLVMSSHSHFVSVNIDMFLHKWNRFGQDVEACANQINEQHLVVFNDTENTFIVVSSSFGTEIDYNSLWRVWFYSANWLTEAEHVRRISVELELSW